CGKSFRRVDMKSYTKVENLYNFDAEGSIIMLGFDLIELGLDDDRLKLLGDSVKKLEKIERLLLNCPEGKDIPEWLKNLRYIKDLVLTDCHLAAIPDYLKEFRNLNALYLFGNKISNLPEWLLTLNELKILNLNDRAQTLDLTQSNMDILKALDDKNVKISDPTFNLHIRLGVPLDQIAIIKKISWYEDGINRVFSETLSSADEAWRDPRTYGVCLRVFEGKILQMSISETSLAELPTDFGDLKDLRVISMPKNKMTFLPESIGQLNNLKELMLLGNNLTSLPETFANLTSLQKLDLSNNQFKEIPTQLWALEEITELNLSNNPFNPEDMIISQKVPDLIREYLRKKATIKVFISHAVIDFEPYRIGDLVKYLEKQKEISQVFFCEDDLAGNIDQWMLDTVQQSQLILFIATKKSVFQSADCANELQLADKFSIPVIPVKGDDVSWQDLAEKNLSRELGLEFSKDIFDAFCKDLYAYIENFKREIDLMGKKEREKGITDIYERFRLMLDEKLNDILRKIDSLDDRISKLEK
ncbi:MAG: hypothetical protein ACFFHV_19545, partial [Promethearchaeota archaeon]